MKFLVFVTDVDIDAVGVAVGVVAIVGVVIVDFVAAVATDGGGVAVAVVVVIVDIVAVTLVAALPGLQAVGQWDSVHLLTFWRVSHRNSLECPAIVAVACDTLAAK